MADPLIITMLQAKQAEIETEIDRLTIRLTEARANLLHVVGVIRLFDPTQGDDNPVTIYTGATKALRVPRLFDLCRAALQASPEPLDTRQLARYVIKAEGWDMDDRTLRLTMSHRIGAMMARFERRKMVKKSGDRQRATVWSLA